MLTADSSPEAFASTPTADVDAFRILVVCTGNICRSPAVERLLRAQFSTDSGIAIASAGIGAVVGEPIAPRMALLLESSGISTVGFSARQLSEQMLRDSDLVLALTRRHRSRIVELHPGAVRRTFTLLELARLAAEVDPSDVAAGGAGNRLRSLLPLAAAQRGLRSVGERTDDVVDPWGGDDGLYRRSFDELAPAVAAIVKAVGV